MLGQKLDMFTQFAIIICAQCIVVEYTVFCLSQEFRK